MNRINSQGFTLIELLVSIGISAVLALLSIQNYELFKNHARISQAKLEVRMIFDAYSAVRAETGNHTYLTSDAAYGNFTSTDFHNTAMGSFVSDMLDPWGTVYYVDGCGTSCNEAHEVAPWGAAICSAGPNKSFQAFNNPPSSAGDDLCIYIHNSVVSWDR